MSNTIAHAKDRDLLLYIGNCLVEPTTGRISCDGREVHMEPRAMDVLLYLASRPGEVISREEIESSVWAGMIVGYDSLTSAIIKLRKAFADNSHNPQYIETVAKRGYRLLAPVKSASPEHIHQPEVAEGVSDTETPNDVSRHAPSPLRWQNHLRSLAYAAVSIAVIATIFMLRPTTAPVSDAGTATVAQHGKASLLVLPFTDSGNNKDQEYFSDGITDDLINDLSQYSGLNVMARRTSYIYKHRTTDIQSIAHQLGVTYVIDGDVHRAGNRLRINVQLIDANTGVNIWARRFDRETKDIFDVQDDIRKNILNSLSVSLTTEERNRERVRYTSSFEAYDVFLQGQAKLVSRASATESQQAQDLMRRAIKLDPNFTRAYAALAYSLADAFRLAWITDPEKMKQEALAAGKRALELDPNLPQSYWIMGNVYLFMFEDFDKALEMGKRAVELAPNDNDALLTLAVTYAYGDDPEKAILIAQDIMKRNTLYSSLVPAVAGVAYVRLGKYPEALAAYNKSLEINPTYVSALVQKVLIYYRLGQIDDAEFQIDELYNLHPNFNLHAWVARLPFKDKSIRKDYIEDLTLAGIKA